MRLPKIPIVIKEAKRFLRKQHKNEKSNSDAKFNKVSNSYNIYREKQISENCALAFHPQGHELSFSVSRQREKRKKKEAKKQEL